MGQMKYPAAFKPLASVPRWVVWRTEPVDGKPTKVPYNPAGHKASSTRPSDWVTFREALGAVDRFDGLGIVFHEGGNLTGIDLDHCFRPDGTLKAWAAPIVEAFSGTYIEISPSGDGLHILAYGAMPSREHHKRSMREHGEGDKDAVEIYDSGRYFTVTGKPFGDPRPLADVQDAIDWLYARCWPTREATPQPSRTAERPAVLEDAELLDRMFRASNGAKLARLYEGDTSGHGGDESAADLAFCDALAFWTGCDRGQMDRIFRASGLYRDKWDGKRGDTTYGALTIDKAIEGCSATYDPSRFIGTDGGFAVDIKDLLAQPQPGEATQHYTDLGNARRLVAANHDTIRFCKAWGAWLIWDGWRWAVDQTDEIMRRAKATVEEMYRSAADLEGAERAAMAKHAMRSESGRALRDMIALAQSEPGIIVTPDQLDSDPFAFNCNTGTLDLRTGLLRPHNPADGITRLAPVDYDPEAGYRRWYGFLLDVMDDDLELVRFLQRAMGYSLTASTRERCMFVLHGCGKNGKSTFVDAASYVLGDYARNTPTDTLMVRHNKGEANNDVARLANVRMVTASEGEEGQRLAEGLIKQLTGGTDSITARFLHKEFFDFRPVFKIWFSTNHKPEIRGTDDAIWDRMKLIPWNVRFDGERQDKTLPDKLKAEASGILNWMLEGCLAWQTDGLGTVKGVTEATEKYRSEMDVMADFLADCTDAGRDYEAESATLYQRYCGWCMANHEKALTKTKFGRKLGERGAYQAFKDSYGARKWRGLRVIDNGFEHE